MCCHKKNVIKTETKCEKKMFCSESKKQMKLLFRFQMDGSPDCLNEIPPLRRPTKLLTLSFSDILDERKSFAGKQLFKGRVHEF